MKPIFQKKIFARLYLLMRILFIAVLLAWLPTIALIASEDGFSRELAFVLGLVASTPLAIEWVAAFFCIRYVILLKTAKPAPSSLVKVLNILYGAMALIVLFVFVTILGSCFQVFNSEYYNVYVVLPVITVLLGIAIFVITKIETKRLRDSATN